MLPDAGPHAGFIWLAYAAAAFVFAGLTLNAVLAARAQKRALRRLDPGGSALVSAAAETTGETSAETPARPPRRALVLVPLAVFVCLALLFAVRLISGDPSRIPSALIGQRAPADALAPLPALVRDGAPVPGWSGAELAAGRGVTVVNVWASWCAPCQTEHPFLMSLPRQAPGIRLVGMNYKDQLENARRFLGAFGNPFAAVGVDPQGAAAIDWGVYGVPETFVVGPDGRIRHKLVGGLSAETLPVLLDEIRKAQGR